MRRFLALLVVALFLCLMLGCTGTRLNVSPSPDSLQAKYSTRYDVIGVKEIASDISYPPAGHIVSDFVRELELSGIARHVIYPVGSGDMADLILEPKFNVALDSQEGLSLTKSFLTGLTLFLLGPIVWYDYDYALVGEVDLIKQGKKTYSIHVTTNAFISMKLLSLEQGSNLEIETLKMAKNSLFRQIIEKIPEY